jgi:Mg2+-importing ATPase
VRSRSALVAAVLFQVAIIGLDTTTMAAVVRALGTSLPIVAVFISFMISSLFRTLGVLPGGLGTFEASSAMTLRMEGASTALAISATMLFRTLSYWLPMLPGAWFARRLTHPAREREHSPARQPPPAPHGVTR